MQWEHLTSTDFAQAARSTGVCIVALGVIEKHSEHLPLGTDLIFGHRLACLAADLLAFMGQCTLWENKPYSLYIPTRRLAPEGEQAWQALRETDFGGHACEEETSQMLGTFPELVKMERVPAQPATPRGRLNHLPSSYSGIWWYGDYPDHYAGDARTASQEKGQVLVRLMTDYLAQYIAAVKADQAVPALEDEFFRRVQAVGK